VIPLTHWIGAIWTVVFGLAGVIVTAALFIAIALRDRGVLDYPITLWRGNNHGITVNPAGWPA